MEHSSHAVILLTELIDSIENAAISETKTEETPDKLGFNVSVGLQDPPLSPYQIGAITTSPLLNGIKYYKFYGWDADHDIATQILAQSSTPQNIKFYIEIVPAKVNTLTQSDIDELLNIWNDMRLNVWCIALGNEPLLNGITFSLLSDKLRMVYSYLRAQPEWKHVVVSIPFSQNIFDVTFPVQQSTFKKEYQKELASILAVYKEYNAPFSINLYPFFAAPELHDQMEYLLGETSAAGEYTSMLGAMYKATYYAMEDVLAGNEVEIIVTETGWASKSDVYSFATVTNANKYFENTLRLMKDSSSEIYNKKIYYFELLDENKKYGGDWERNFGVYDQNGTLKVKSPISI
eukprot:253865_1